MLNREDYFAGHSGLKLFAQSWLPADPPRAALVFVHGLLEHSGRHARMAQELTQHGFSVHAHDLRGHGRSEGPRCDVRSFEEYLLDLDLYFERIRRQAGDLPIFLMGNSMGGLISANWTISRRPKINGLILSGSLLALAEGLFPRLRNLSVVAAAVAPRLRVVRIPFDWLASDPEVVDSFHKDPLMFHGRLTVRVAAEVHRAMRRLSEQATSLTAPLLILHGSSDRICKLAGCQALYQRAGSIDKTFHLYDGFYHEIFDEPERARVLADLTGWLNHRAPGRDLTVSCGRAET